MLLLSFSKTRPGRPRPSIGALCCYIFRVPLLLLLAATATIGSAAVGPRATATNELDIPVFSGGYGLHFYIETARLFEAQRPGVKIRLYGDPRIEDQLRVRLIDGNFPDATLTGKLLWPTLIKAGRVLDLTPALAGRNWEGDAPWAGTFFPGALDTWRVGGRVYGLGLSYACWSIFYNRGMFREHGWQVPVTWDEFFSLCDRIRASGVAPLSLAGTRELYPDALLRAAYYNLAGAAGWNALNDLAPGARVDPRYIRAAGILQRITQTDTLRGWEGESHTGAQLAFLQGLSAMTVSGSWFTSEMRGKIPAGFELGVMNFPIFPEGVADPSTVQAASDCFFIFATGHPERERLAVDFLRFLTSRERARAFVQEVDAPVAVRGVALEAFSPGMRETAAMISRARETFNMPQLLLQPPAIRQALTDARLELMLGRISPQEFGSRVEDAAALDRARAGAPEHVEMRHPWAATALLLGIAGLAVGLTRPGWSRIGGAFSRGAAGAPAAAERAGDTAGRDFFGRLRWPVAVGFVGPAFVIYFAIALAPGLVAFAWSFTRWNGFEPRAWVGWFNFKWLLFENDGLWSALRNNIYLMTVPPLVVVPLALFLAWALHRGVWGTRFFRSVFLFPNLLGGIAATLLWQSAYAPHGGLVNAALVGLGRGLHICWLTQFDGHPWLAQEHLYTSLLPIYLWMACGFNLVLYLAAMEGIDAELYEAAELDGAGAARQFFLITLPLMREVVVISVVFLVISGLNAFEMIWLLTSQDPATADHTLGTLMVSTMFKEFQIGRATALAVLLFVLVALVSAVVLRAARRNDSP